MKTPKSEEADVTPSKKKLKQARLPFKLLSGVTPATETTQTRKRKLSAPESEPVTKLGKITKENDKIDDLVVISDEDSKDATKTQTVDKKLNPYVKLVDSARKKKQKSKTLMKKNGKDFKNVTGPSEIKTTEDSEKLNGSIMDVDDSEKIIVISCDGESMEFSNKNNDINTENEKCTVDNIEVNVKEIAEDCIAHKTEKDEIIEDGDCNKSRNNDEPNMVTPKRSTRNRSKLENKLDLNTSQTSEESAQSNITPRQTRNSKSSCSDRTPNNSTPLTPKQVRLFIAL